MDIDKDMLSKDLFRLKHYLLRHRNYSQLSKYVSDLDKLNKVMSSVTGFMVTDHGLFINKDEFGKKIKRANHQLLSDYYDEFDRDGYLIEPFCINYINNLQRMSFIMFNSKLSQKKYSEKDLKDIVLGFFSTFDNKFYNKVKTYFRIQFGVQQDEDYGGEFLESIVLCTSYMIFAYKELNTLSMSSLVHELGHLYERELFIFPQAKNVELSKQSTLEVPSCFFELLFLEYIIQSHIDIKGGELLLNDRYNLIRECAQDLAEIYSYDNGYITNSGDVIIDDDNGSKLIFMKESYIYSLGYYIGSYLCDAYNQDKKGFKKMFDNMLCSRCETTLEEKIRSIGLSPQEFTEGKFMRQKVLKINNSLKKRYNINI